MKLKEKLRRWLLRKLGAEEVYHIHNIIQTPLKTICLRAEQKYSKEDLALPITDLDEYVNNRLAEQLVDGIRKSNAWTLSETYNYYDHTITRQATLYVQIKENY